MTDPISVISSKQHSRQSGGYVKIYSRNHVCIIIRLWVGETTVS